MRLYHINTAIGSFRKIGPMLSHDDLNNGSTFILKLQNIAGISFQWVETLRGDTARRWYDIYRNSDWNTLRAEAAAVFRNSVTEREAERARKSDRCVYIHTPDVTVEGLVPATNLLQTLLPSEGCV
jgi:hypothetical protein